MKILIIDDNPSITNVISKYLNVKGHDCIVSNDGKAGLALIKSSKFDIILLDLAMPEFTGYDVLNSIGDDGLKHHKIIVLTAAEISDIEIKDLTKKGVLKVLRKPVPLKELEKKLKSFYSK